MCGRYTLSKPQAIPARFNAVDKDLNFDASYNIAPGFTSPVVFNNNQERLVKMMKWGLVPFWADDINIGYKMINARRENIENKPAYRVPVRKRRCLIPATGFYEWKPLNLEGKPEKYPWYYTVKNMQVFAFAGLFDIWKDKQDHELFTYTIVTTDSNELVDEVHPRMPVILEKEDEDLWTDPGTELNDALELLDAYPAKNMQSTPVSRRVNSPRNDDPNLLKPVDRPELNELFD